MSLFLSPRRQGSSAIAICDRCHMKKYLSELIPDGDIPGLLVCSDCRDQKDRYKLKPRDTENITLSNIRKDVGLTDA